MEHEIQRGIILKLIHMPRAAYNELRCNVESNLFAYHLKKLQDEGLVEKFADGYGLSDEGKKLSAFIEGDTGGMAQLPTPTVIIVVRDGATLLCQKRLKEPYYGYWGLPSGKINFGWNPKECALRDLEEETGLRAEGAVLREIEFTKSLEGSRVMHHHLMFTYEVSSFTGTLKERTHKAINAFLTKEELLANDHFPGDWSRRYFSPAGTLRIMEKERVLENGALVSVRETHCDEYALQEGI